MHKDDRDIFFPDAAQIAKWPRPDAESMPKKYKAIYESRVSALLAMMEGTSINRAAKHFDIHRKTLTKIRNLALEPHSDGRPWGFRSCIPFIKKGGPQATVAELPGASAPHAFAMVLASFPHLKLLVDRFTGSLPNRGRCSPKFNRLYAEIKKTLVDAGVAHMYPLNTQTQGRRPLIAYIRHRRSVVIDAGGGSGTDAMPSLSRMDQIVNLLPLERVEFDAHRIDMKATMLVYTAKGEVVTRPVGAIWLLAIIDVATRAILAWLLVYGPGYKRFPVLRLFAKALTPWHPRPLNVANLHYSPGAWMPSLIDADGVLRRALTIAMDNAKAHHADDSIDNTLTFQLGVINAGYAHVAQARAHIESIFKTLETQVIRYLSGGFEPARVHTESAKPISIKKAAQHPIDPAALEDLMDVCISAYNAMPHSGLQGRSPREAFESYYVADGWYFASSRTADDVEKLTEIRTNVTIRGYRSDGKPPEVRWKGARYRSPLLLKRWDLVGKTYPAKIRFDDARKMRLLNPKTGELFVTLEALPPWHATPHTLEVRERAMIYLKNAGSLNEELIDAVEAYHEHTRLRVVDHKLSANHYVQAGVGSMLPKSTLHKPVAQDPSTYTPSTGWVSFRPKKEE